jgi:serine/threonine-protein kinase
MPNRENLLVEYIELQVGEVLKERYLILEMIGRGGMGVVYKAQDLRLEGRLTAIKEIRLGVSDNSDYQAESRRQFYREASILARLDHPTLPKVSDFFVVGERDFLVMDFIEGRDLRELIEESIRQAVHLPERSILNWADQIAQALHYLHTQDPPVLHRDIKPANLKITPSGLIKLVDFGLVKVLNPDESRTITVVQGRGSVHYTPLEQYGGDTGHTDVRSDIYAFGATLYHLATNRPPLEAKQRFLAPNSLLDPRRYNPDLSERTAQAILWAMSMHPDQRPRTVLELRDALLSHDKRIPYRVAGGLGRVDSSTTDIIVYDPDMARGNVVLAFVATLLFIAALFVTFASPPLP